MFGDQLIVLSSYNHILQLYDKQEIAKDPETNDQVVPVIMVGKQDDTIDCIDNVLKAGVPAKPERLIQNRKKPHVKVRKERAYAYIEYNLYVFYSEGGQLKKFTVDDQGFEWTHGIVRYQDCNF